MKHLRYAFALLLSTSLTLMAQEKKRAQLTRISHSESTKHVENLDVKSEASNKLDAKLFPFYHGLASGDPTESAVIIWTRVTPKEDGDIPVSWKVSTDVNQQNIVQQGTYITNVSRDYTVKVDVKNLQPGTTYYYSFQALGKKSLVGRARTTPKTNVSQLRFAVVACSNYQNGYFNVYDRLAERNDIDAIIHLGDYIYEYEEGGFGYSEEVGRGHEPNNETISLQDYRVRHSFYKLDPALQKAHLQHSFITIWDDHEFTNDAYVGGAENHQPATEGSWQNRKNNAWKAYFEWMPIRENTQNPNQIYRKIQYGNLMDLILLDTRIEGRDEQETTGPGGIFFKTMKNAKNENLTEAQTNESLLKNFLEASFKMNEAQPAISREEFNSLYNRLVGFMSKANWDLNKVENKASNVELNNLQMELFEKIEKVATAEAAKQAKVNRNLLGEKQYNWLTSQLKNSKAKWKVLGNQVLMMPVIPMQLKDTWNGYQQERDRLYQFVKSNKINNLVVITGDIHMTFVGDLPESLLRYSTLFKTGSMGVEFVTPSVTSSNLDEFVGFSSSFLNWLVATMNPHIKKADLSNHGYFILDVKSDRVQADWNYVNTIKTVNSGQFYSHSYMVKDGKKFMESVSAPSTLSTTNVSPLAPTAKTSTSVEETTKNTVVVLGNYPNPTSDFTDLHFAVTKQSHVKISLYNDKGELVSDLVNENLSEGLYDLTCITQDLKEGLYFIKLDLEDNSITKKIVIKH